MGWRGWLQRVRAFMAGAAVSWMAVPYLLRRHEVMRHLFALEMWLTLQGLAPFPGSRRLYLLPYVVPQIMAWHRHLRLWDDSLDTAHLAHLGH